VQAMTNRFSQLRFFDTQECATTGGKAVSVIDLARHLDRET